MYHNRGSKMAGFHLEGGLLHVLKTHVPFYYTFFLHIAKLIGRVCGAKRPHSVSKQPIYIVSL